MTRSSAYDGAHCYTCFLMYIFQLWTEVAEVRFRQIFLESRVIYTRRHSAERTNVLFFLRCPPVWVLENNFWFFVDSSAYLLCVFIRYSCEAIVPTSGAFRINRQRLQQTFFSAKVLGLGPSVNAFLFHHSMFSSEFLFFSVIGFFSCSMFPRDLVRSPRSQQRNH